MVPVILRTYAIPIRRDLTVYHHQMVDAMKLRREQLVRVIEGSGVPESSKARALAGIFSSQAESFEANANSKREILKTFGRRITRERPIKVEGEDTFLEDIDSLPSETLRVLSIPHDGLVTSIWMNETCSALIATLTAVDQSGEPGPLPNEDPTL